eukprot:6209852-Pleurochrysis_carterae.AAC.3
MPPSRAGGRKRGKKKSPFLEKKYRTLLARSARSRFVAKRGTLPSSISLATPPATVHLWERHCPTICRVGVKLAAE